MRDKWSWFYSLVEEQLEPIFEQHGFHRLTGRGYEPENDSEAVRWYEHKQKQVRASIDVLTYPETYANPAVDYFLIRVNIGRENLKQFLYPNIRKEVRQPFLWSGWKCFNPEEAKQVFKEITTGLERYFREVDGWAT